MTTQDASWQVHAVASVTCSRTQPTDDNWDSETTTITLLAPYTDEALLGIDSFSHLEIVYLFHVVDPDSRTAMSRHPRGNSAWPTVGVFAQRVKDRPNRIGISTCQLIDVRGTTLHVRGLDAIDGTPVIDIKPYIREFGPRGSIREPYWASELMQSYYRQTDRETSH